MTAVEWLVDQMRQRKEQGLTLSFYDLEMFASYAKEMEKEQKQRFNKFLNDEIELGISDKKTIERIQWYYNNYLSTFKSE